MLKRLTPVVGAMLLTVATYAFAQDANFWYLAGINEPDIVLVMDRDKEYLIVPARSASREAPFRYARGPVECHGTRSARIRSSLDARGRKP